ncbi:MAG: M67 family metallopeptidase [Nitrospirota bacterium]
MLTLTLPRQIFDELIGHAREAAPHECCGLLAGKDGLVTHHYKIKNIVATEGAQLADFDKAKFDHLKRLSPEERAEIAFSMDAQEQSLALKDIRTKGLELQAFYHSHPHSPSRPSSTDIKIANDFEGYRNILNLPEPFHIIISLENKDEPVVNVFRIVGNEVTRIPYQIT